MQNKNKKKYGRDTEVGSKGEERGKSWLSAKERKKRVTKEQGLTLCEHVGGNF